MIKVDLFGEGVEFDHIGMSMKSIEHALGGIEQTVDPTQKVAVAFFDLHGAPIEAVQPQSDDSPVASSLNRGIKLLHLCFRVPNLDNAIRVARRNGLLLVASPTPATAFDGRRIAWLFSETMGLFELLEASRPDCPPPPAR